MTDPYASQFLGYLLERLQSLSPTMTAEDYFWLAIGLAGQCLFMMRFIVQWIYSERHKQSLIPKSFWYLSLGGASIVLAYGIHKMEPVIILGQLPSLLVYIRNLMLIHGKRRN